VVLELTALDTLGYVGHNFKKSAFLHIRLSIV
jgi:hypothetical protein